MELDLKFDAGLYVRYHLILSQGQESWQEIEMLVRKMSWSWVYLNFQGMLSSFHRF